LRGSELWTASNTESTNAFSLPTHPASSTEGFRRRDLMVCRHLFVTILRWDVHLLTTFFETLTRPPLIRLFQTKRGGMRGFSCSCQKSCESSPPRLRFLMAYFAVSWQKSKKGSVRPASTMPYIDCPRHCSRRPQCGSRRDIHSCCPIIGQPADCNIKNIRNELRRAPSSVGKMAANGTCAPLNQK
jgi:hypothetical protein